MIRYVAGNLLDSPAQTLVNTVNCVGVMGKGIALEFKRLYPAMYKEYAAMCERHEVLPGVPYCHSSSGRQIVNFPTKDHWRAKSRLEDVERGLRLLRENYRDWNITSIAMPPLGCGNGGLEWGAVKPLIERYLSDVSIDVFVYEPGRFVADDQSPDEGETQLTFGLNVEPARYHHH